MRATRNEGTRTDARRRRRQVVADSKHPRDVTVALIAIHVVFTIKGHPEFLWSTFEHVGADARPTWRRRQPPPKDTPGMAAISTADFTLYKAGTPKSAANTAIKTLIFDKVLRRSLRRAAWPRRRSTGCSRRRSPTRPRRTTISSTQRLDGGGARLQARRRGRRAQ